jgi:tetrapyrrole methylase family protein/MazG family protein
MGKKENIDSGINMTTAEAFKELYDIAARLRAPSGCPWDREQTPSTLRGALIEETYECIEAIDENNPAHIAEELGDLFLITTMLAYIYEEEGIFSVKDVLVKIKEKLIRRHPHVFNQLKVKDTAEVLNNWEKIKNELEGRKPRDSILDSVGQGIPPMDRANKLQKKASKAGFDWLNVDGVFDKIKEELEETYKAVLDTKNISKENIPHETILPVKHAAKYPGQNPAEISLEEELGDLLFSVINLCRYLKIEPSAALRRTNSKFVNRFRHVEMKMKETGNEMKKENLDIMEKFWTEAKTLS